MHPLISILSAQYSQYVVARGEQCVMLALFHNRDARESILVEFECLGDANDTVRASFQAKVRYPLAQTRHQQYLKALGTFLAELNISLYFRAPRTVEFEASLGHDSFADFTDWEHSTENIAAFVEGMVHISAAVTLVAHLNHRLPERGGTEAYRRLLPSRLAALTVCGLGHDASMH